MKLEDIGFYTLSDARAKAVSWRSPMWRCEMILTDRCNFSCAYCRGPRQEWKGEMPRETAMATLSHWITDGLRNVRFSGGEPLLYPHLADLVRRARAGNVGRIAISSNGSMPWRRYEHLVKLGVNDWSISFDACCSSGCKEMSGGVDAYERITENIRRLSKVSYVTVGVVITDQNAFEIADIIHSAAALGVDDIRIISAAQQTDALLALGEQLQSLPRELYDQMPILKYRVTNLLLRDRNVRGIGECDSPRCHLLKDDMVVAGGHHYPCVIYMREHGDPVGPVGPDMREDRRRFFEKLDTHVDPICRANCLDVCIDHNNVCEKNLTAKPIMGGHYSE